MHESLALWNETNAQLKLKAHSQIFGNWKPFKNDEKRFFCFHLQRSFCSQDIYIFVLAWLET